MTGPKEAAYDNEIAPLMTRIIEVCKLHKINMAATFSLDEADEERQEEGHVGPMMCTTVLGVDESDVDGHKRIMECRRVMYPQPSYAAFTITTVPGAP
jgi:hypothetical protein